MKEDMKEDKNEGRKEGQEGKKDRVGQEEQEGR
jgi:hypothetical protein